MVTNRIDDFYDDDADDFQVGDIIKEVANCMAEMQDTLDEAKEYAKSLDYADRLYDQGLAINADSKEMLQQCLSLVDGVAELHEEIDAQEQLNTELEVEIAKLKEELESRGNQHAPPS